MESIVKDESKHSSTVAVTFLQSRCLATISDTHADTDCWEGFMKYVVEMGSVAMIYVPGI
jgi:hypothetical protein